jgi:signal transduction histidine kinase/CheY-like chemotaxis protein/HPt (histidine-containing phosphotransfer) domain-containing protein
MNKTGEFISQEVDKRKVEVSSTVLPVIVIVLSFSVIVALWLYTEQTAEQRFAVFFLSLIIIVSVVVFIDQMLKRTQLNQFRLQQLIGEQTSELELAKTEARAALSQTEQINRHLEISVAHVNLLAQQAMEASQNKNEFLANMSHEIRTPMNAIIGFSEMLAEGNLTEQQKKQVDIIRDSSKQLLQLINDIVDFSRIEVGKVDIKIADCGIENILTSIELLMRPAAAEKKLKFEIIHNEPLPHSISTDAVRLKQCLINLIGNAIKFTDRGYVRVRVLWEKNNDKPFIRFNIEDTGIGISSELLNHVFEPFSHSNGGIVRRSGSGLGLVITKHLVELLSGSVSVSSTAGKGSVFSLVIPEGTPSVQTGQDTGRPKTADKSQQPSAPMDNIRLSGRALIVEDSPTNQMLLELLLKKAGLQTVIAENGRQAVQKALAEKFDVILMDIQMPVMNGYEAARQLRQQGVKTPIIAQTACAQKGDDEKCFAAGCDDYIPKPIDRKKLIEVLSKYLSADSKKPVGSQPVAAAQTEKIVQTKPQENSMQTNVSTSPQTGEIELDWNLLMERIGSEELIDEIMPIFIKDNSERMRMLTQAMTNSDDKEIKFYAHSLKGATATIGASAIAELAKQLETASRDLNKSVYGPLYEEIKVRFARLMDLLAKSDWKQIAQQASGQRTEKT